MARGNQRDKAREKNQKKLAEQNKGNKESGTATKARMEGDAEIMRKKQEAALAKKAAEAAAGVSK